MQDREINSAPREEKSHSPHGHNSALISRNIIVDARRTSVRLEPQMWSALSDICQRERVTLHEICTRISGYKQVHGSLASAIRTFVMSYYREAATENGHVNAGHGYSAIHSDPPTATIVSPHVYTARNGVR